MQKMRSLVVLGLFSLAWANGYDVASDGFSPKTEFFTYTAPENFVDAADVDVQRFTGTLRPQRVVFIQTPEANIYTRTAEQLAMQDSVDIYVLSRQTSGEALAEQFNEIQMKQNRKPHVYFVKYRTAEDAERAEAAIKGELINSSGESDIGRTSDERPTAKAAASNEDPQFANQPPIIFKILSRGFLGYETYEVAEN